MSLNGDYVSMSLEESDPPILMLDASPVQGAESNSPADLVPVATIVTPDYRCKVCQKGHPLRHCKRFNKMPVLQRLRTVVKYRYCARCLALSHITAECASERRCHVCGKDHHSLLHENEVRRGQTASLRMSGVQSRTAKTAGGIDQPRLVKPTIQCYALVGPRKVAVRVLLDLCANDNLVNVNLGPSLDQRLAVGQKVTLILTSYHDLTVRLIVTATGVNNLGGVTPELPVPDAVVNRFNHFKLADTTFNVPSPPQVILCAAVYAQLVRPGFVVQPGLPVAQETIFGYMLTGSFV